MNGYKTDQRRLLYRGREFHFVSYEGLVANPRRGQVATPAAWFLMSAGKRHLVMPQVHDLPVEDLDQQLIGWLDAHVFESDSRTVRPTPRRRATAR